MQILTGVYEVHLPGISSKDIVIAIYNQLIYIYNYFRF